MRFGRQNRNDLFDIGARYRAEHSIWLTHALRHGGRYPRIPAKPTHLGGYDRLMSRPTGRRHAERWWTIALARLGIR